MPLEGHQKFAEGFSPCGGRTWATMAVLLHFYGIAMAARGSAMIVP